MTATAKLIVNDVHLGVMRASGTTPKTAYELRAGLQAKLRELLMAHLDVDAILNGDLFDTFQVPLSDVLEAYETFSMWLEASRGILFLVEGNHDWSKDSSKLSSFAFLGRILQQAFPARVFVVSEPLQINEQLYVIPHMPNQDMFDLALKQAEALRNHAILLHANYDNHFAVESDHSLNVSREQAERLVAGGNRLIFGHEHQARRELHDKVWITGNQWPSSVADCLHNPGDRKFAHLLNFDTEGWTPLPVETWAAEGQYADIDWRFLSDVPATAQFVRVSGEAPAEQAADVVDLIAKFRQTSHALVITNAVKVAGSKELSDVTASVEQIKAFDVLAYLFENLDPAQVEFVRGLLARDDVQERRAA